MRRIVGIAALLFALFLAMPGLAADINATLKGEVTDTDGLPVPSAGITLISPDMIGGRSATTDTEGRYRFTALPPGDYEMMVEHPSFTAWNSGLVKVNLGATVRMNVVMVVRDSGEVVEVRREAPTIDVENTATGVVLDSEFLRDIPTGREYHEVVAMAPGVVGGGNPNVQGAFDSGNQYYIDGVNATDPLTSTFSMNMNYDAIDSVEVITGGMDAEYGRSLGGAINIVTKSGGNDFEGHAMVVYSGEEMQGFLAEELEGDSRDENQAQQIVLNIGGPIQKDKAWFFGSLQGDRYVSTTSYDPSEIPRQDIGGEGADLYPLQPRDWRSMFLYGKVTWQPSPAHRIWVHAQADPTWIDNTEQDPYTLPSGEWLQNQGGWLASAGHHFTPNPNLLVTTQAYLQYNYIQAYSMLWKDCKEFDDRGACTEDWVGREYEGQTITEPWLGWDSDGFSSGEASYASFNKRWRASLQSSATVFFDLAGEHEVKTGLQFEFMSAYSVYPGIEDANVNGRPDPGEGFVYYTHNDNPTDLDGYSPAFVYLYDNDWETYFPGIIGSYYLQDVWKPFRRLTIRPGLRFDFPRLFDDRGDAVFSRLTVAPRIGASFDLTGDGRTSVRAHYGRFFDSGYLIVSDLLRQKSSAYAGYAWDDRADDWAETPSFSVASTFLKHEDLRNPYQDAFNFGVSRDLGGGFGVDATFVYKYSSRFWEDDEVNLIWNEDGTDVIGYRNGENTSLYRMRTPDEVFTRYTSMELVIHKTFGDNWGMLGSYTWSRAYGTNDSDGATYILDIPPLADVETGLLTYDQPHVLKLTGSYEDPDTWALGRLRGGWVFGWNAFYRSGSPYNQYIWNDYYEDYINPVQSQDGRFRLPMYASMDLRAGVTFYYDRTSWMLGVDVFNLFNDRTITAVNQDYDPEATAEEQTFGEILGRQRPRSIQVVLRGEF
jgi:hypothetical protein